ncbi:hypothetical protein AAE478_004531 [Parahypoxylon ruwenzoriense]
MGLGTRHWEPHTRLCREHSSPTAGDAIPIEALANSDSNRSLNDEIGSDVGDEAGEWYTRDRDSPDRRENVEETCSPFYSASQIKPPHKAWFLWWLEQVNSIMLDDIDVRTS